MPRRRKPVVSPRKKPLQARSQQLVADVLKAAVRILEREGSQGFTTIRVAEVAGVSVGSLYQYFPNKESILFRLQVEEWEKTGAMIDALLEDESRSPEERLRSMIRAFFQSECDEAPLRLALDAAAPNYHQAAEARDGRRHSRSVARAFIAAAAPRATSRQRTFATDVIFMTMTSVGKQLSERRPSPAEVARWADTIAAMLTGYLSELRPPRRLSGRSASTPRAAGPRASSRRRADRG